MKSFVKNDIVRKAISIVVAFVLVFVAVMPMVTEEAYADSKGVSRVSGSDRYATSLKVANLVKSTKGVSKFNNIIIASGKNFPDALSGSYLAKAADAPILLVDNNHITSVANYVKKNLKSSGTAYILGGKSVVSSSMETTLKSNGVKNIVRLGGSDRYETNALVLKEGDRLYKEATGKVPTQGIICSSKDYPDALTAGATGLPIVLAKEEIRASQKKVLANRPKTKYTIAGGTSAVSERAANQMKSYGTVSRLSGDSRYSTAVLLAKKFFGKSPKEVIVVSGNSFADGLSAAALAQTKKVPILLTNPSNLAQAYNYTIFANNTKATLLGGKELVSAGSIATTKSRYSRGYRRYNSNSYIFVNRDSSIATKPFNDNGYSVKPTKGGLISGGDTSEIERRMDSASYGTAIVIQLDEQKLDYAENGVVKFSTDIISGLPTPSRITPKGEYYVNAKKTDIWMKGADYLVYSDYWLGFITNEYGIHDAPWIGSEDRFGGDTYKYSGSHGCINVPPSKMPILFDMVSVYTKVIIKD